MIFSLLLLHGAGSSDKNRTKYLQDLLSKHRIKNYSFNFSGSGGKNLLLSSLKKRLREAQNAIKRFNLKEPLSVCGSSMGGYIAIKLLETHRVQNLILFAPAVYNTNVFTVPFDNRFTEIIRKKDSWKNSDAIEILKNFTGNVLIFIGDKDEVIPNELIKLFDKVLTKTKSKEIVYIPNCPHTIHRWLSQNKEWTQRIVHRITGLLK